MLGSSEREEQVPTSDVLERDVGPVRANKFWCTRQMGPVLLAFTIGIIAGVAFLGKEVHDSLECDARLGTRIGAKRAVGDLCVDHTPGDEQPEFPDTPHGDDALHFLAIGDWGRDGWCCQQDVAVEMDYVAQQFHSDFVINTGDNFYPYGIDDANAEQVDTSWRDIYGLDTLGSLKWYSVLGNHDYRGTVQAQLDLSAQDDRFVLPSRNYTKTFGKNNLLQVVFIDTNPMIKVYEKDPLMQRSPDGWESQRKHVADQLEWLHETLSSSQARWKIVVGHHPIYTAASHRGEGSEDGGIPLDVSVKPILEAHGVHMYFSGHDHVQQHLHDDSAKLHYVVTGAGSKTREGEWHEDKIKFFSSDSGFVSCFLSNDELSMTFIDYNGRAVYRYSIPYTE